MSVVVDAAVVVGAEDGVVHVEDAIVDVAAAAAADECFVVEKKMMVHFQIKLRGEIDAKSKNHLVRENSKICG